MTEVEVVNAEQNSNAIAVEQASSSAGQLLRQAREHKQMSLQTLASALKVPAYKLQALEEDRWDVLTDSVFTRSLALSVCRVLQMPSDAVLAGLPKHEAAKLAANPEGINAPFKEKTLRSLMSSSTESSSGGAAKLVIALVIALAGGAGLYFLPHWQTDGSETEAAALAEAAPEEPLFMPQAAEQDTPAAASVAAVEAALTVPSSGSAGLQTAEAVAVASAEMKPADAAKPAAIAALPAGSAMLRFTAKGETWVQVRDAQQRVVLEKILKSGDVLEEAVAGRPLSIVVGNASATTLEVDGAAFDLTALAKNNVARLEVK